MAENSPPELSVALPAYLEAANLRSLLPEIRSTLERMHISFEILVIDTQTPLDETPSVCAENGVVHLARIGGNLYSHAVKTAIRSSSGDWLIMMDADGSHPPSLIPDLWSRRKDADLVIASRYVQGGETENPFMLILLSRIVNVIFRLVLRLPCSDVSNSFRLYCGQDVRRLDLTCENFDVVEEILVKLMVSSDNYRIDEVPFTFRKRKEGQSKRKLVMFAFGYLSTLWKLSRMAHAARKDSSA